MCIRDRLKAVTYKKGMALSSVRTVFITMAEVLPETVTLSSDSYHMFIGDTRMLTPVFTPGNVNAVSYTHLDVYKRQPSIHSQRKHVPPADSQFGKGKRSAVLFRPPPFGADCADGGRVENAVGGGTKPIKQRKMLTAEGKRDIGRMCAVLQRGPVSYTHLQYNTLIKKRTYRHIKCVTGCQTTFVCDKRESLLRIYHRKV